MSTHSSSSRSSSHSNRKSSRKEEGKSDKDKEVVTSVRGDIDQPSQISQKAEVLVQTKESWDMEGLQKLEQKLAVEKSALIDAEKLVKDQTILFSEAQKTKEEKLILAQRLEKVVSEKAADRDRWLQEEKNLELKRAAAHEKAVAMESSRTETLAQAVLSKEEAKVSDNLSLQRQEGIRQAQALADAHRLALQKLEEHRIELKRKEVDVSVRGEALPQPKAVDINVAVKPLDLPEARVSSSSVSQGAGASSHIHESLPAHQKTVIQPNQVQMSEQHVKQQTVERHVITNRDQTIS